MRRAPALSLAMAVMLLASACTAGTRDDPSIPSDAELTRSTTEALALLAKSPLQGYGARALASGHDRADDKGREVSQAHRGRALFQIVCSGTGKITVTMARQQASRLVRCGQDATGFPFRGRMDALVVGERDSTGAYAWRILPAT